MVVKRKFVVCNGMLNQLMWARTICVVKGTSEITRSKNNVFSNITTIFWTIIIVRYIGKYVFCKLSSLLPNKIMYIIFKCFKIFLYLFSKMCWHISKVKIYLNFWPKIGHIIVMFVIILYYMWYKGNEFSIWEPPFHFKFFFNEFCLLLYS